MKKSIFQNLPKIQITPKAYLLLPETPGVYMYFKNDFPIYVGKAKNLKRRVASYFRLNLETKTSKMINEANKMSFIKATSDLEALLLEARLIKMFMPKYNIVAKDDKHPLYIQITKEELPRIKTVRKSDLNKIVSLANYGPFPSSTNVKFVLKMLRKIFPYSDHKLGKRACLYSQIGLCYPCPNEINNNNDIISKKNQINTYKSNIRHIKSMLDGKIEKVKSELEKDMKNYSQKEDFENAALIRNKILKLEYITSPNINPDEYLENPNLYEDIRKNELNELKSILSKFNIFISGLKRIECYDVAHLQGKGTAASMVVFIDGEAEKNLYRHFKVYQESKNDDYASMREIAKRRIKHLVDWGKPNLIIVDGGKGQLSMFLKEFNNLNIPVIGLAKRFETLVIPVDYLGSKTFKEFRLPKGSSLNLVQRIRNEAHRFAQRYHHKLISKSLKFDN